MHKIQTERDRERERERVGGSYCVETRRLCLLSSGSDSEPSEKTCGLRSLKDSLLGLQKMALSFEDLSKKVVAQNHNDSCLRSDTQSP